MTITRINQFDALPGRGAELRRFLESLIGTIRSCPGCHSCELLQSIDQDERLAMIEIWEDVDAHRAAAKAIPPSMLQEAMALLAGPAAGAYFHPVPPSDA